MRAVRKRVALYLFAAAFAVGAVSLLFGYGAGTEEFIVADGAVSGGLPVLAAVPQNGPFILLNTESMRVTLYESGQEIVTLPIVSVPKADSAWYAPQGEYSITRKLAEHFSPLAGARLTRVLSLSGNILIHEGGEESGAGGFQLLPDDMEMLYTFAAVGTPVFIEGAALDQEARTVRWGGIQEPEGVRAASYAVVDAATGAYLLGSNADTVRPIASIAKLVTAAVARRVLPPERNVSILPDALQTEGDAGNLAAGDAYPASTLLFPLLLESSNDAAEALAGAYGRAAFIEEMNAYARTAGLWSVSFKDPSGLSAGDRASAVDMARLLAYIAQNDREVFAISRTPLYRSDGIIWRNNSPFLSRSEYRGGKHGYTDEARDTAAVLVSLPVSEFDNRTLAISVLGSADGAGDIQRIIRALRDGAYYR